VIIPALIPELVCSDYLKSLKFYTEVLGFTVVYDRPESFFAMLERQGARLMIEQYDCNGRWNVGEMIPPFGRGINLRIETTDIQELYVRIEAIKIKIFMPMEEKWYRAHETFVGNKQFLIQDPDGYLLRFFENLGDKDSLE
jgi:predicted enzyme related to lactoylglutathione lyase